jgi:hypothetical protein
MTRVDAVPPARTGGDVVNLDFCNESYNVDFDYSRVSSGSYIGRNLNQFNQYDYVLKNDFVGNVENLFLYSEQFNNAAWVKLNTTVIANTENSPIDNKTADSIFGSTTDGFHNLKQVVSVTDDVIYTMSVFAKFKNPLVTQISLTTSSSNSAFTGIRATFNLKTGAIVDNSDKIASSQYVGNGWFRFSLTNTATATASANLEVELNAGTYIGTGDDSLFLWGFQLNTGDKALPYVKTLSTAVTQAFTASPRIEYDYVTGECLGYLAEGASTNLFVRSEELDNASWSKIPSGNGTAPIVTANFGIAPDGTLSADKVVFEIAADVAGDRSILRQATTAGAEFNQSFWIKSLNGNVQISIAAVGAGILDINITSEWQRFDATNSTTISSNNGLQLQGDRGTGDLIANVLVWGAQCEALPFTTSYIRTEGSTVTRAVDSLEPTLFSNIGTVFVNANFLGGADKNPANRYPFSLKDSGNTNSIVAYNNLGRNVNIFTRANGAAQTALNGVADSVGAFNKVTVVISDVSDSSLYTNGVLTSSISNIKPKGLTLAAIGSDSGSSNSLYGHVKKVTFYNYEMTADEVKAL